MREIKNTTYAIRGINTNAYIIFVSFKGMKDLQEFEAETLEEAERQYNIMKEQGLGIFYNAIALGKQCTIGGRVNGQYKYTIEKKDIIEG